MKRLIGVCKDSYGYAVVEATILFPVILLTFAALTMLAMYLPTRVVLQNATQYAATAMATEQSDTWLEFDEKNMEYSWGLSRKDLDNVYVALVKMFLKGDADKKARTIVTKFDEKSLISRRGELKVECKIENYVIYKEIIVTATRNIPLPVDLSLINFPKEIPVVVSSTAVVQNGDEFVRNMDIAAEFADYLVKELELEEGLSGLSGWLDKAWKFLGV